MIKMIRVLTGGTWLKLQTNDNKREYWIRPVSPESIEQMQPEQVVQKECYGKCLLGTQELKPA